MVLKWRQFDKNLQKLQKFAKKWQFWQILAIFSSSHQNIDILEIYGHRDASVYSHESPKITKIGKQRGGSIWLYDPNPGTRGERPKFFLVFGDFMTQKCGPKYEISLKNLTLWPKNTQNVGFCAGMSCNPNPDKFVSISTKNFQKIWSKTKIRRSKNKVENRLFSSGGVKCDFMTQIPEQGGGSK